MMDGTTKRVLGNLTETVERVRKVRADAHAKWTIARSAFQDAQ
jgi:hypothetical protein